MSSEDHETYGAAHWDEVRRLFRRARQLPPDTRGDYLQRECSDDDILRREVERMLAADHKAKDFLTSPIRHRADEAENGDLALDQRVGPFRISGVIGQGAMGKVYRAEREDHFRMSVALKVIHADKVDDEMLWRFSHERQILAWLDHPNIARLIDGGTLDDGRPWLALQYVDGEPIDTYCDRHRLTVGQRLRLFRKVCSAVDHAHGLAVVHRDLKPANILVNQEGEPKLLDFGIAKIVEGETVSEEATTLVDLAEAARDQDSDYDSNPMTPRYASPEQVRLALREDDEPPPPIGVRSDLYALGVVLYELLTGHPPYSGIHFWKVLKLVVDESPRPASEVVGSKRELRGARPKKLTPQSVAEERGTTAAVLSHRLKGDLDAILRHALQKQPEDRYASAAELDADLKAHLEGYPVMPRQKSTLYRAGRFLRRNFVATLATAASLMLLASFSWNSWRAAETRRILFDLSQDILDEVLADEESVNDELRSILSDHPDRIWLADHLEDLGLDLENRGHVIAAQALYSEALAMRQRLGAPGDALARAYNNLAGAQLALGDFATAEKNYFLDLELREQAYGADSLEISRTLNNLGALYQHWGGEHLTQARPRLEEALRIRTMHLEPGHAQILATRNNLATQHLLEKEYPEARAIYQELLDILPDNGSGRQRRAHVLRNLAVAEIGLADPAAAEQTIRQALEIYRGNFLHWRIADAESVLGASLAAQQGEAHENLGGYFLEQSHEHLKSSHVHQSRQAREAEERRNHYLGPEAEGGPP